MKRIYLIIRSFDFYRAIIFHLIKFYILIYIVKIFEAALRLLSDKNGFLPRCAFTLSILNLFVMIPQLTSTSNIHSTWRIPSSHATRVNISTKFWLAESPRIFTFNREIFISIVFQSGKISRYKLKIDNLQFPPFFDLQLYNPRFYPWGCRFFCSFARRANQ